MVEIIEIMLGLLITFSVLGILLTFYSRVVSPGVEDSLETKNTAQQNISSALLFSFCNPMRQRLISSINIKNREFSLFDLLNALECQGIPAKREYTSVNDCNSVVGSKDATFFVSQNGLQELLVDKEYTLTVSPVENFENNWCFELQLLEVKNAGD